MSWPETLVLVLLGIAGPAMGLHAESATQSGVFESRVGSPYRIDFDSGWFPTGSDLQFEAFFFASPGEAHARYAADFTASWDSASAIPGNTITVHLKVRGDPDNSRWHSDGGLRYGARYRVDTKVGGVKLFAEDYVPYLPHMNFSWPCIVDPAPSLSLGSRSGLCSLEWGAGGNCVLFVGDNLGSCYPPQSLSLNPGLDLCLPLPEEPNVEQDPEDSTKVTIEVRPYEVIALDFSVAFGLCVDQRAGTSNLRDVGTGHAFGSESDSLSFTFTIPCDMAVPTKGGQRLYDFDLGPMAIAGDVALALVVRMNPQLAACFAETVELSIAPNIGLCFEIPVQIPLADFDFNTVPLHYQMPIADPVVRNVKPDTTITTNFMDPVKVTWQTSWDLPNNPCNLKVHGYYRFTDVSNAPWQDINSQQPQGNTGEADWDLSGQVFAACRNAQLRIDLLDPNGRHLATGVTDTFLIDVESPVVIAQQPTPGATLCAGDPQPIDWQLPAASCGTPTPKGITLYLQYSSGRILSIATDLPGTTTGLVWQIPPNVPSDATAALVIEARDDAGNVGNARIEPLGINQPADVSYTGPGGGPLPGGGGSVFPIPGTVTQFEGEVLDSSLPGNPCGGNSGGFEVEFSYLPQDGHPPVADLLPVYDGQPQTVPGVYPVDLAGPGTLSIFPFAIQPAVGASPGRAKLSPLAKATQVDTLRAVVRSTVGVLTQRTAILLISNSLLVSGWSDQTVPVLADAQQGRGALWADADGDRDPDLYVTNAGNQLNRIYRNDGPALGFSDWSVDPNFAPLADTGNGQGAVFGDLDGDFDPDLYLVNVFSSNRLFENVPGHGYQEVTPSSIADPGGNGRGASLADVDLDGDLDLYVGNAGVNRLYRNDGGLVFTDVTAPPVDSPSLSLGVVWADYDEDGDPDLFVCSRDAANRLLRNDGAFTFTDVAPASGLDLPTAACTGAAWLDYDGDLDLDLYICVEGANHLFRNDGPPGYGFTDVTATSGAVGITDNSRGVCAGDFDLNGFVDLYVVNAATANVLLSNQGGFFFDATTGVLADAGGGQGVAKADYDGDGDEDLYLVNSGDPNRLLRNDQNTAHHWLQIDLRSTASNRRGIGARVEVFSGGAWQMREVAAGTGLFSSDWPTLTFGLGVQSWADTVKIRWPSGLQQIVTGPGLSDRRMTVWEAPGSTATPPSAGWTDRLFAAIPNPFNPSTRLCFSLRRARTASLVIYDLAGRRVRVLLPPTPCSAGMHDLVWRGKDDSGRLVASGVYLYRLVAGDFVATRRMTILK